MRKKLIELLDDFSTPIMLLDTKLMDWNIPTQQLREAVADHLIANGVTIQKWIPVTERLPEDDEQLHFSDDGRMRYTTVLAYTEYGRTIPKNRLLVRPTGNEYLDQQVTNGYVWSIGTEDVTHWMPLPQPPKGE